MSGNLSTVSGRAKPIKVIDDVDQIRCVSGSIGIIREEVWIDAAGEVVRYNLAFIHHQLCRVDNGRVLGYDNAHEVHERHWMGSVNQAAFQSYKDTFDIFIAEVAALKEEI